MEDDRPVNRRGFFREALRKLVHNAEQAAAPIADALKQFDAQTRENKSDESTSHVPRYAGPGDVPADVYLRPPGALPEGQFRQTCSRCGRCAEVCPAQCIKIDSTGTNGHGVPYIDADSMPCVVCESLACMNTCPSGALRPIPLLEIDMGTAVWRGEHCVRTRNEECRICVEKCPIGSSAIDLSADRTEIVVNPLHCIGCGLCQHYCPTSPKAIIVIPAAARRA